MTLPDGSKLDIKPEPVQVFGAYLFRAKQGGPDWRTLATIPPAGAQFVDMAGGQFGPWDLARLVDYFTGRLGQRSTKGLWLMVGQGDTAHAIPWDEAVERAESIRNAGAVLLRALAEAETGLGHAVRRAGPGGLRKLLAIARHEARQALGKSEPEPVGPCVLCDRYHSAHSKEDDCPGFLPIPEEAL